MTGGIAIPDDLPEPLRSRYSATAERHAAKFQEIVDLVDLPAEEVEELVENWEEADIDNPSGVPAKTPLQVLLAEHHELGEELLDLLDTYFLPNGGEEI
jgi:hypothetical protein